MTDARAATTKSLKITCPLLGTVLDVQAPFIIGSPTIGAAWPNRHRHSVGHIHCHRFFPGFLAAAAGAAPFSINAPWNCASVR